ncbi:hypothetical protein CFOL_v3_07217 [Cephalotus follicularis]|uniref:Uncharacterized protein n=1 Tax=Cephalotus follicularis TaxID=3775 RepID=A0A1Q3B6Z2_CEPFO|nr:hypothetical protein CFOL_v3_07217 [Cephalotus follicularis]
MFSVFPPKRLPSTIYLSSTYLYICLLVGALCLQLWGVFIENKFVCAGHSNIPMDPELIRQLSLQSIKNFPTELVETVANSESDSLSLTPVRYRAPCDILLGRFHKGIVAVTRDAMHVMGSFLGQGGSASVEDAIVLARCLAHTLKQVESRAESGRQTIVISKVGEALDQYVK